MLLGYLMAFGLGGGPILWAFLLQSPAFLGSAFLHPKFGSLIWMNAPMFIAAGLAIGVAGCLSPPLSVRVEPQGIAMRGKTRTRRIEWDEWRAKPLSLGYFGGADHRRPSVRPPGH
jgi:hypothetical protein